MRISVVIPTYEMYGRGVQFLQHSLNLLEQQIFRDFEIVISDNSLNDDIKNLCKDYKVRYFFNHKLGMAANTNFGIQKAQGELIKILYQDDFLIHRMALADISNDFKEDSQWLISGCEHTNGKIHFPNIYGINRGQNTIGSPSVITIRNDKPLLFDESMKFILDIDYYKRMIDQKGFPVIMNKINVMIGLGPWQETNHLTLEEKNEEHSRIGSQYR